VFWSILHKNLNIALNENLSRYAQGDTFWQAESDFNARLKMYYETGINKVEIFVEKEGKRYAVKCANSSSFTDGKDEQEALMKYVEARAKTSLVNTGDPTKI